MYNVIVEVNNYKTFPEFLDGNYRRIIYLLNDEENGEIKLAYPYIRNLRKIIYNK